MNISALSLPRFAEHLPLSSVVAVCYFSCQLCFTVIAVLPIWLQFYTGFFRSSHSKVKGKLQKPLWYENIVSGSRFCSIRINWKRGQNVWAVLHELINHNQNSLVYRLCKWFKLRIFSNIGHWLEWYLKQLLRTAIFFFFFFFLHLGPFKPLSKCTNVTWCTL